MSLFLGIGTIELSFQVLGNFPVLRDRLNILHRGEAIERVVAFSIFVWLASTQNGKQLVASRSSSDSRKAC